MGWLGRGRDPRPGGRGTLRHPEAWEGGGACVFGLCVTLAMCTGVVANPGRTRSAEWVCLSFSSLGTGPWGCLFVALGPAQGSQWLPGAW